MAYKSSLPFGKRLKSTEDFKNIWMSLFDIKVLSSCGETDPDLFCASALLKTSYYSFISLKKKLKEVQEKVESQNLELKALYLEKEKYLSKLCSIKTSGCANCQKLSVDVVTNLETHRELPANNGADETERRRVESKSNSCISQKNTRGKKSIKGNLVSKSLISALDESHEAVDDHVNKLESNKEVKSVNEDISEIVADENFLKKKMGSPGKKDKSVGLISQNLSSPPRNVSTDIVVVNVSPIIKPSKKSKISPGRLAKLRMKKLSLLSCKGETSNNVTVERFSQKTSTAVEVEETDVIPVTQPNKKHKSMSSRLQLEQSYKSPENVVVSEFKVPRSNEDNENNVGKSTAKDIEKRDSSSENEEDNGIVMASPNTTSKTEYAVPCLEKIRKCIKENQRTFIDKSVISSKRFKKNKKIPDTDVTFFAPLEEHDGGEDEEYVGEASSSEEEVSSGKEEQVAKYEEEEQVSQYEEEEQVSEHEEEVQVTKVMNDKGAQDEEMAKQEKEKKEKMKEFLDNFNRLPSKNKSPPYKYVTGPVRKKAERMKLNGWACRQCEKYYETVAHGMSSQEKRKIMNKCSRHRDKYSPQKPPKGFWNPLFPDTPE